MSIALADMQSLSPKSAGAIADAGVANSGSTEDQFPDILNRQLSHNSACKSGLECQQAVDLKEILSIDALPGESLQAAPDMVDINAAWLQQPVVESATETITVELGSITTPKPAEVVGEESIENTAPVAGHGLPAGGIGLPPEPGSGNKPLPAVTSITTGEGKPIARPLPISMRETGNVDAKKADSIKLGDLRATDPAIPLPGGESGLPVKPESQNEILNSRVGELHGIQGKQTDIAELSNSQHRLQNHTNVLPSSTIQQNTAMLPTSLETMSVSNSRSAESWGNGIGERVHWMINQKLNTATIRLDPPMLGRLEVSIRVSDDITHVTINTQHAQTRDLIDNASFKLRDYLQENGYQNVNVDVSQEQEQGQQASSQTSEDSDHHAADAVAKQADEVDDEGQLVEFISSDSVVDYFV